MGRANRDAVTCAGCLLSAAGAVSALWLWGSSGRTWRHLGHGFEGEGTDYGAVLLEFPLVLTGGALQVQPPPLVWGAAVRLPLGRRVDPACASDPDPRGRPGGDRRSAAAGGGGRSSPGVSRRAGRRR
ncbi:hypothetical protein SFUMM280S_08347 [Streptomyces fumanus]